jgi:serine protease inhibitor
MVELPYKGDDLSMVIIAPNDPAKLSAIEKAMTSESLTGWIGRLKKRKTHVYLPKFKVETDYTLGDSGKPGALQKMGMVRAFVDPRKPKGAVFDGMSHATNPQDKLYVTKVFHKAFVEVNEKGTEAAAATAVIMVVGDSAPISVPFTPTFKADRPFIYLIRDRQSGAILFLGRMMEPRAG